MRDVLLASVRTYARRYVAAAVAIVVGVGFIVTTDALASATRNGLLADVGSTYTGAEQVMTGFDGFAQANQAVADAEAAGVPAALHALTVARVDDIATLDQTTVGTQSTAADLRWQELTRGRFARGPGEAVLDVHAAEAGGIGLGETIVLRQDAATAEVTVTGLVRPVSAGRDADVYLTRDDIVALDNPTIIVETVLGGPAAKAERVAEQLAADLPVNVITATAQQHVTDLQTEIMNGVDVVQMMLLVFAAIALFVAVMVIANTFTVLLAQRRQDFALLRCVGATRKQVLRSVLLEAVVVGVAAATVGVLAGVGLGRGLATLGSGLLAETLAIGSVEHSPVWLLGAWGTGLAVTVLASVVPARRSTRTAPLAALRPESTPTARNRAGILRIASGLVVATPGVALLVMAMEEHELPLMIAGGFVSFLGVLLLGPLLVPAAVRLAGVVTARLLGVPGALAASNAVRNPRRTAATASALLVGVTLITGMVVGMATVRTTVATELDAEYPVDVALTSSTTFGPADVREVVETDGVAAVAEIPGALAEVSGRGGAGSLGEVVILAATPDARPVVHGRPGFLSAEDDVIHVPWGLLAEANLGPDTVVNVRVGDTSHRLRVAGTDGVGDVALVSTSTLQQLAGPETDTRAVWVRATAGADPGDVVGALSTVARTHDAVLAGGLPQRDFIDLQLDVMLGAVLVLLAVSVAIALVGVGSTLGLSVLERTREHALLRAIGLTRRQLRRTLAVEAVLLAGVAGVLGVLLGTAYAWVGVRTMIDGVVDQVTFVVPPGQLAAVVATAAVAGLLAGVLPARRAARISPAAGLTAD